MDLGLELWVSSLIELSKLRWMLGSGEAWTPGKRLRLLFAGYNGNRNTGADVRVQEMIRQVQKILGEAHLNLSVLSHNLEWSKGYFDNVRQVKLPDVFPLFLMREVSGYHGVLACEGSMFKSKFANALSSMMIGALGMAAAQNKLSIGYGAEAGSMDWTLKTICRRYCSESLIITRNEESQTVLGRLGVPTELGTDTAWTFEPHGPQYGEYQLKKVGWDGHTPILGLCPINPFWWPVQPSLSKLAGHSLFGFYKESYYRSIYFHHDSRKARAAFQRYITAWCRSIQTFRQQHRVFPILIGMEALDRPACELISQGLGSVPVFVSDKFNMYELVSILRQCHLLLSSRYHGVVTSMPAGVASAGVTMDERLRNLMRERGHSELLVEADDPDLEPKLEILLSLLLTQSEEISSSLGGTVVRNLKTMARMGVYLQQQVVECYPEFPIRSSHLSWEDYLPTLSQNLIRLVKQFEHQSSGSTVRNHLAVKPLSTSQVQTSRSVRQ